MGPPYFMVFTLFEAKQIFRFSFFLNTAPPGTLYGRVDRGFISSALGFRLSKREEFKKDAIQFATAGKILQKKYGFSKPEAGEWKKRINFEDWMKNAKSIEWLNQFVCITCEQKPMSKK